MAKQDTPPEVRALQAEIHRRMGGPKRVELALDMSRTLRETILAGIRGRHPGVSEREAMRLYFQDILARPSHRHV
jgi:hypothetical protein